MADFLKRAYADPMFHAGAGLMGSQNIGQGLLRGMGSYQDYQANQQQLAQQQQLMQMRIAQMEEMKRQQEAQRQQAEQQRAAQTRVLQGMAPAPTIPFQRGGEPGGMMDIAEGYPEVGAAMVKGKYAPNIGQVPSKIQVHKYYAGLSPEEKEVFDKSQRATQFLNLGGQFVQPGTGQTFEKTLPPQEQPKVQYEQAAAQESAKQLESARGKWRASETKLISTIDSAKDRQAVLDDTITKAKTLLNELTTSYGALIAGWPSTDAKRLSNLLDTIKANVGFTELQSLRDNSPTGGALGQVSEMENRLLQSVLGSLDQAGDASDLAGVLDTVSAQRAAAINRLSEAYSMDKSTYGSRIPERKTMTPKTQEGWSIRRK